MRLKIIIVLSFFIARLFTPESVCAGDLNKLAEYLMKGDYISSKGEISKLGNELSTMEDSTRSDFYYLKAAWIGSNIGKEEALPYYKRAVRLAASTDYYYEQFYDALWEIISYYRNKETADSAAYYGTKAVFKYGDKLKDYPYSPYIIETSAHYLNTLHKLDEAYKVEQIGGPIFEKWRRPNQKEYYNLKVLETVTYMLMMKPEKADSVLAEIEDKLYECKDRPEEMINNLSSLKKELKIVYDIKSKHEDIAKKFDNLIGGLILAPADEKQNYFGTYYKYIRDFLSNTYFDLANKKDEGAWRKALGYLIASYAVYDSTVPNYSKEIYDNLLVKRNFLDYHGGKLYKKRKNWIDVKNNLDVQDVAIELSCFPDEAYILYYDSKEPIVVELDSSLTNIMARYINGDALKIEQLYKESGVLSRFWSVIDPYLKGRKSVFLAGDNFFNQFNYAIVRTKDGQLVGDKYDYHLLTTTADIERVKQRASDLRIKNAILYGGIKYDVPDKEMLTNASPYVCREKVAWNLTRGLTENERGVYGPLPFSEREVQEIGLTLEERGVKCLTYTGPQANEESLKFLSGHSPELLHISTHGFFLSAPKGGKDTTNLTKYGTNMLRTGLLFAGSNKVWCGGDSNSNIEDGILTANELRKLDLSNTKLAVLSACETGCGDLAELTGLVYGPHHALKTAGVEQVVMSLWNVNDEATSILMTNFYKWIVMGKSPKESLRLAQKHLISNGFRDYYYWGAFVVLE